MVEEDEDIIILDIVLTWVSKATLSPRIAAPRSKLVTMKPMAMSPFPRWAEATPVDQERAVSERINKRM